MSDHEAFYVAHEQKSLTSRYEKKILIFLAERMPSWVTPDGLTGLGIVAALTIGTSYLFAGDYPYLLWVAVLGWFLHWFGDSLDGTLARVRRIERPRYGHYLDHFVDSIVTLYMGLGFAFSGLTIPLVWIFVIVGYYLVSIHAYLFAAVEHRLKLSYGIVGPTEVRILFVFLTVLLWFTQNPYITVLGHDLRVADIGGFIFIFLLFSILAFSGIKSARYFERVDRESRK